MMFGIGEYNFRLLTEDSVIFSTAFMGRKLKIKANFIEEIHIHRIQGILHEYKVLTMLKDLSIPKTSLKIDEIKAFAIRNDITLIEEEIWHGGEQMIIHQSKR